MAEDQTTPQDPTSQHAQPDNEGEQIAHPGRTGDLRDEPDHGEESYRGSGRLEGKKAVITGGDSGIGRAVAIAFAREGADVLIVHLPEEEDDARTTVGHVEAAGRQGVALAADIREEDSCQRIVDRAVQEFGRIDVLVNNAAYQMAQPGGLEDITTEQLDRTFKTNLYGMFWLTKKSLPHMGEGSSIINTASIQAYQPSPPLLDYATTKAGIVNFTKGLGQMLAERGIRVNCVAPGPIWTPLIPATMPEDAVGSFGEDVPLGRAGQPAELAPAYVFFASQESSYITAEVIGVTGGKPIS
ncbi:SDR family oxidoreductase [Paenibacillus sp. TRM 82003]|uniref:SDR family oxidoreductase n=1 Tax=Kineococcus sp. TRM81007 TaxID=2925831 RepID=UPI001F59C77A|nr:SDR family oxidoreductase [Kineococcus sp. TRM81007]MCI2237341.1 SDR family oxidoreductase [Kineococcus sp. TRM81007]MCI3926552.1 SDR family oxidoreductase [Paenibacillus sp. TRM 82003]